MNVPTALEPQADCVCGEPATTRVRVQWADGVRRYRYCDECAAAVVDTIEGAEVG